jgi:hypothetical protein
MTQEDKKLLLQDLCCRLPYGVNVDIKYSKLNGSSLRLIVCSEGMLPLNTDLLGLFQEEEIYLKPYLRPMTSMTEKEKKELFEAINKDMNLLEETLDKKPLFTYRNSNYMGNPIHYELDFLISHHFDYRGLIPKGLALEAPEDMYKN